MLTKIKNFMKNVNKKEKVNLLFPFVLVIVSMILVSLPGVYITYTMMIKIPHPDAKNLVSVLGLVTPLFIGIFSLIGWIITMGIYYNVSKLFLKASGFEFRKFLFIAGNLFPIKAFVLLGLSIVFFRVYGFGGFYMGMPVGELEKFFVSWNIAKTRIELFATYLYLTFLALTISTTYEESIKKTTLVFLMPYTIWFFSISLVRYII